MIVTGKTTALRKLVLLIILVLDDAAPFVPLKARLLNPVTDSYIARSLHELTPLPKPQGIRAFIKNKAPTFILEPRTQTRKQAFIGEAKTFFLSFMR